MQTPQPPAGARQNQIDKPGTPAKAVSSALKGKETESESSSSSDSEEEMIPPTQQNLPPPFGKKPLVFIGAWGPLVFSFSVKFLCLSIGGSGVTNSFPKGKSTHTHTHKCALKCQNTGTDANYSETDVRNLSVFQFCICFVSEHTSKLAEGTVLFEERWGGAHCFWFLVAFAKQIHF